MPSKPLFELLFNFVFEFRGEIQANVFLHVETKHDVTKEMNLKVLKI